MKIASLIILVLILIGLIIADGFLVYDLIFHHSKEGENVSRQNQGSQSQGKEGKSTQVPNQNRLKIVMTGDIMLDRGVALKIKEEGNGDFKFPFLKIAPYLQKADIVFGNLEGPITADGVRSGSEYSFRFDPKCIEGLKYANFSVLNLANNHILDYGRQGLIDTLNILKDNGILYVGAGFNLDDTFSLKVKEVDGIKVGFLAFTSKGMKSWWPKEDSPGVAYLIERNFPYAAGEIQEAKKKVDVLIVSLHEGEEYQKEPTDFQKKFAQMAIDSGADIVVGHHPHVVQPLVKYKNGWIAYSLGNFIFDQTFSNETMEGEILEVEINTEKKTIEMVEGKKIKINEFFQPYLENLTQGG